MHSRILAAIITDLLSFTYFSGLLNISSAANIAVSSNTFSIKQNTALPEIASDFTYKAFSVINTMHCVANCTRDPRCQAVYVFSNHTTPGLNSKLVCQLMENIIPDHFLVGGDGHYGHFRDFDLAMSSPVQVLADGTFDQLFISSKGVAAAYDCSAADVDMTDMAILYDYKNSKWPEMHPKCFRNLCKQLGLAGTLVTITEDPEETDSFILTPVCEDDEFKFSNVKCNQKGNYTYDEAGLGNLAVGCLPTECYRKSNGRAVYKGNVSTTVSGIQCQRWADQVPWGHSIVDSSLPEDGFSLINANNYCRDPDFSQAPWCYQLTGNEYGFCGLQKCRLRIG